MFVNNTFRKLASGSAPEATIFRTPDFNPWFERWQARLKRQPDAWEASCRCMNAHHPAVIPRNHRVEPADFSVMDKLLGVLPQPYVDPPEQAGYHLPPPPYRTFCGT